MKKKSILTATSIQKTLSSCRFNPQEPGTMKVILDCQNPEYFLFRAIESINSARTSLRKAEQNQQLTQAIRLLTTILVMNEQTTD